MHAQPFTRHNFDELLQLVAGNAAARPAGQSNLMTSDVAWQFPGCAPKDNVRLWRDDQGLSAYAWFQPPDTVKFDVRSDINLSERLLHEILSWVELRRSQFSANYPFFIDLRSMDEWADAIRNPAPQPRSANRYLVTSVLDSDTQRQHLLAAAGFRSTEHHEPIFTCNLQQVTIAPAPDGFHLRHVQDSELAARVALHAAAWAPAAGFSMAQYLKLRSIQQVFQPELDIVAVTDDGAFASYTIAWVDPVSQIGSFEPFGTHPDYRGTGVSRAVIGEGFHRQHASGMHTALVYTAGFNHQAQRLYSSCGFSQVNAYRTMIKQL